MPPPFYSAAMPLPSKQPEPMGWKKEVEELKRRRAFAEKMGGAKIQSPCHGRRGEQHGRNRGTEEEKQTVNRIVSEKLFPNKLRAVHHAPVAVVERIAAMHDAAVVPQD